MGEIAQTHWDDCYRAVAQSNVNERKEIEAENEQLKARLAAAEKLVAKWRDFTASQVGSRAAVWGYQRCADELASAISQTREG